MDAIQKRCLAASVVMHGALLATLLLTAAFTGRQSQSTREIVPIHYYSGRILDSVLNGGGGGQPAPAPPTPQPPAPSPAPPAPAQIPTPPQPQRVVTAPPPPPAPAQTQPKPRAPEAPVVVRDDGFLKAGKNTESAAKPGPKISTKLVTRQATSSKNSDPRSTSLNSTGSDINARVYAQHRQAALQSAISGLSQRLSQGGLNMSDVLGPGGGGPGGASYAQVVLGAYDAAWNPPPDLRDDEAVVTVRIVVHRSGKVLEARIIKRSDVPGMNRSVQDALEAVRELPPFPEGATDLERVFKIDFNLKNKRAFA